MQQIVLILALFFTSLITGQATEVEPSNNGVTIHVKVSKVISDKGNVSFALFTKENFMTQNPVQGRISKIKDGACEVQFENIAPNTYAIICFHDENENQMMDFYENGMPKESFGTSNNVFLQGPPEFESSKFEVGNSPVTLEIKF